MGKSVVHWEINAKDAPRLQKFYRELFDWKIDANNPMNYGMVTTGGAGINGGIGKGEGSVGVTFYVEVEDLQEYLNMAQRLGGKILQPPTAIPGAVTFAMFADPEGNRIGMIKAGTMSGTT
jgi:predicted enzyme related to lactoylglutathione lyase